MAVFLSGALVALFGGWATGLMEIAPAEGTTGIFGGPTENPREDEADMPTRFELYNQSALFLSILNGVPEEDYGLDFSSGELIDPGQPLGPALGGGVYTYKVQQGDTLSGIAAYFGVSLETIINANPGVRARFIRSGDELNILPTSGVVYSTRSGDTLESIAEYFGVSESKIMQFNQGLDLGNLGVGVSLIIPGAKTFRLAQSRTGTLPSFAEQFVRPTEGFNWGRLHNYNAVDIANSCGTTVRAAAEGLVIPDNSFGDGKEGWNGGYGKFVLIEHPFGDGVRTRYAHLAEADVNIGDYVKQGEIIGTMGRTGDATGCHLHFEVYGAANPLAR